MVTTPLFLTSYLTSLSAAELSIEVWHSHQPALDQDRPYDDGI